MSRPCYISSLEKLRQTAIQCGDIAAEVGHKYNLTNSLSFSSPSAAATFVLGGSANGWKEWKNKDGKTLDEIFRK